jgi:type 1 fimbriae regulatory protein FimB
MPRAVRTEDDRKYLTEEELVKFLKVISDPMHRAIFTVMYWRGLRASEPGRLPLSAYRQAAGRLYVTRRKGSDSGEYPLSPAEQRTLKAWLKVRGQKPGPLFPSREGGGISRFQLARFFLVYAINAGIPENLRHCHSLKHSIGTHLIGKGTELFAVKDWLGHKDIKSTMVYVRFRSKQRDSVAEQVYGDEV